MYIIGIDIGKNHHEASIIDAFGNPIGHSLRFSNTHKGADRLMAHIARHIPNESFLFGMEATGHYWYSIYYTMFLIFSNSPPISWLFHNQIKPFHDYN